MTDKGGKRKLKPCKVSLMEEGLEDGGRGNWR